MASDTYYKDMWLRRNKGAIQVVIVLLSVIAVILIIQTTYRRHPGMGQTIHGADRNAVNRMANPGPIRGRVFDNDDDDDDFDPDVDVDAPASEAAAADGHKSDCCTIYDLWRPAREDYECSPLNDMDPELPPTLVCFYPEPARNAEHARLDPETAHQILKRLRTGGPSHGFLDLGAGLGAYSLLAAASQRGAVAVEPNALNVARFHKAAKLGRYERYITLLANKVGSSRDEVTVVEGQPMVKQILMDDLPAFCKFRKAILRMNLGGEEHLAFQHAKYLFKEIQITYVFFDWNNLKELRSDHDLALVADMIEYFNRRGYVPRGYDGKVLSTKKWQQWPNKIYWQKM